MRNVDRTLQNHRFFGVLADNGHGIHRFTVIKRRRIELCAEQQNIVPVRHRHFGAHCPADRFARHRHFVNFFHITRRRVVPRGGTVIRQVTAVRWRRGRLHFVGNRQQIGNRLFANRTAGKRGNRLAFLFLIVDCPANSAFVDGHKTPLFYF